jgi:hypothetical protein
MYNVKIIYNTVNVNVTRFTTATGQRLPGHLANPSGSIHCEENVSVGLKSVKFSSI